MAVVVDASVTMAWCFQDETTDYTESTLDYIRDHGAVVPAIWPLEVANTLLIGERRARLTAAQSALFLDLLQDLPVTIDDAAIAAAWGESLSLGRGHAITAYDACYVALALRTGLPLAAVDKRLREAAVALAP